MGGWIKLHRQIIDNENYLSEPFCRNMAWIDLLLLANHENSSFMCRGISVKLKRGQVGYTSENLGKRWKWSRGKVLRYLSALEKQSQITQQKNNVTTLISILNYERYQQNGTTDGTTDGTAISTTERQQTDTNKNDKNYKKNIDYKIVKPNSENFSKKNEEKNGTEFIRAIQASGEDYFCKGLPDSNIEETGLVQRG